MRYVTVIQDQGLTPYTETILRRIQNVTSDNGFSDIFQHSFAEKLYVVERERGSPAVIQDGKFEGEIRDLGNLNHAIVKQMVITVML